MNGRRVARLLVDGVRRLDPTAPVFGAFDLAPTRGDGAFESVLVRGGRPRKLAAHLARLSTSADRLELSAPTAERWTDLVDVVLDPPPADECVLKLLLSRGEEGAGSPIAVATVSPVPAETLRQRREGIRILLLTLGWAADVRATAPWLLGGVKSLSYAVNLAALRHAHAAGAEDVLFVSADGRLLEGPTSTLIWARGQTLHTPPTSTGTLPGTTQRALFAVAERAGLGTATTDAPVADLETADGVWLVSSIRGAAEVTGIDGVRRPPAALTGTLRELLDID